eukprot:TRINITY_DN779824_c0_g1_i1.p1 TRINITY_DN779824_c0_g1~~TRINITY_DN779824_c0_g1_i1.p1  ORF type:complete len:713 (+),score=152.48 TRINITY_DN779824_c0_g1_i1:58-2196(+)
MAKPSVRPACPNFSSGPCPKRPGFDQNVVYADALLGRSHRSAEAKAKITKAMELTREVLNIPEDYKLAIVPASDTGAIEMCMWSMMGARKVTTVYWDAFGEEWFKDITTELKLEEPAVVKAPYGEICDFSGVDFNTDVIFTFNGTTSGVRVPDLEFIPDTREGLVFCDATSAAFAMDIDWKKTDVSTFSWQKALGGEAAHGMLVLSPAAVERLTTYQAPRPLPKIFRMMKGKTLNEPLFKGNVINTISMLCIEDYLDAIQWVKNEGGLTESIRRSEANLSCLEAFVEKHDWIDFLCKEKKIRSCTSVTMLINDLEPAKIKEMTAFLGKQKVAFDINSYAKAPAGIRIWCGCTVETSDLEKLCPWLEYAHAVVKGEIRKPRVLICDGLAADAQQALKDADFEVITTKPSEEELDAGAYGQFDCVIVRSATKIRQAHIDAAVDAPDSKLAILARAGVGVDNLDCAHAESRGVMCLNTPMAATRSVVELAIAHLFAMARKVTFADAQMHAGAWPKKQCVGTELQGKNLGIVGYGNIGRQTALVAQAIGMKIHAYDPYANKAFAEEHGHILHDTIEELFKACTHISVHCNLMPSTKNLINEELCKLMPGVADDGTKCGNYLVSVARGGVVDEESMLKALESGAISQLALDVFASEPMKDSPLLKHPNFNCTPHIGASTKEGQGRVGAEMAAAIISAISGDIPQANLVTKNVKPRFM